MSDASIGGLGGLKSALRRTAKGMHQTTLRAAWYGLVWRWLALLACLFLMDLFFALPVWMRWAGLIVQALFIASGLRQIGRDRKRLGSGDEWAARIVEDRYPQIDNAWINAVQFERAMPSASADQAALMRREIARAGDTVGSVTSGEVVDRLREQAALKRMAVLLIVWAVAAVVFSNGLRAVLPRLFAPWMDNVTPPFSATQFDVRPPGATVRYGDSLTISVTVSGRHAEDLSLMTQTGGKEWQRVALDADANGGYSVKLESITDETWFYVQGSTGRSARYKIAVTRPPNVTGIRATYTYPSYTARPPSTVTVGSEGLHGLAGTGVALEIAANRPLSEGVLTIQTAEGVTQTVSMTPDAAITSHVTAHIVISRPGEFHIALTAADGQVSQDAAHGKITLDRDQKPSVWFAFPGQDLLVTPDMTIPVVVKAEDENGVQSVEVHRVIDDLADSPLAFPSAPPAPQVDHGATMDLQTLGVRPGDRITYYAVAYDTNPSRPQIGQTETFTLKVVTKEEFAKALRDARQVSDLKRETDELMNALKDIADKQSQIAREMEQLKQALASKPGDSSLQKKLDAARQEQKALQQQAKDLAKTMDDYSKAPAASPIEQALKDKLGQLAAKLAALSQGKMQQAASSSSKPGEASEQAKSAADDLQKMTGQAEQQIAKTIANLEQVLPLFNDIERFMALLDQQGNLVLRAREMQEIMGKTPEEKSKLGQLADEQSRIARELIILQRDFITHADAAEANFPKAAASARQIAAEIGERQIPSLMETGRDRFREWDGPRGFENAQKALQQMQAMLHDTASGESECKGELNIALQRSLNKPGLGNSLGQLNPGQNPGNGQGSKSMGIAGQAGGANTPAPYTPSMRLAQSAGGGHGGPHKHANHIAGAPAGLAPKEVEVINTTPTGANKAGQPGAGGFPASYRKLINEYFKSVAEHQ